MSMLSAAWFAIMIFALLACVGMTTANSLLAYGARHWTYGGSWYALGVLVGGGYAALLYGLIVFII
jgi:hypothetical protein